MCGTGQALARRCKARDKESRYGTTVESDYIARGRLLTVLVCLSGHSFPIPQMYAGTMSSFVSKLGGPFPKAIQQHDQSSWLSHLLCADISVVKATHNRKFDVKAAPSNMEAYGSLIPPVLYLA